MLYLTHCRQLNHTGLTHFEMRAEGDHLNETYSIPCQYDDVVGEYKSFGSQKPYNIVLIEYVAFIFLPRTLILLADNISSTHYHSLILYQL